jgi:ribosomal protein S18 acetylase RimI-like enzyme
MALIEVRPMTREQAECIADWDFGEGYRFYNIEGDPYVIEEFQNGHYYSVFYRDELVGFFCDGETATVDIDYDDLPRCLDIGLALRPDMTSQGYGSELMAVLISFYTELYRPGYFRLTVAAFNQRAVRLYQQTGFQTVKQFEVDGMQFYVMVMKVPS